MDAQPGEITQLLVEINRGNEQAMLQLMPLVYGELKRLAGYYLNQERPNHTLQPTALVHEAYLRLVDQRHRNWRNKNQFVRLAANMMRRVLVDYSRKRNAGKRGGQARNVRLEEGTILLRSRVLDILAVDDALQKLAALDERQAELVELRFFGGLSIAETAKFLGISPATAKREWNVAKVWLAREMGTGDEPHA